MVFDVITIIVLPTLLVVVAAVILGRRRAAVSTGEFDSASVGFAGGVLSALFTVVLAFYIVFAWQLGADIGNNAGTEGNAVVDAYWQADRLPEPDRGRLHGMLRDYAKQVAGTEWYLLADGRTDPQVPEMIRTIRAEFAALSADGSGGTGIDVAQEQGLRDLRQIDESQRARVELATERDTFNNVLLIGTIIGAALMIAFPLLVGLSAKPVSVAVMALTTITITATVFLAIQLTRPLDGLFGIQPDAFQEALAQMQQPPDG